MEKLELHAKAVVMGNITCKTLFMDHSTTVVGTLNVNPFAPQEIDNEGKIKDDGKGKKSGTEHENTGSEKTWRGRRERMQRRDYQQERGHHDKTLRHGRQGSRQ